MINENATCLFEVKTQCTLYVDLNEGTVLEERPDHKDYKIINRGSILKVYQWNDFFNKTDDPKRMVCVQKNGNYIWFNNADEILFNPWDWFEVRENE